MKMGKTIRGFYICKFRDSYGSFCSLQESSAARLELDDGTITDGKIWLGIDRNPDGSGIRPIKDEFGLPVYLGARMHLTQSIVKELLPLLQHFAEHGELPENNSE